jgi:hypothetical protein
LVPNLPRFPFGRNSVLKDMRLPGCNTLFGLPVVMDTTRTDVVAGESVALNFQVSSGGSFHINAN